MTTNDNNEISSLEAKLLNFAKKGQPVLLHGFDSCGREDLIKSIHGLNGGIDACWEYVGAEKEIESMNDLEEEVRSALKADNYKKAETILLDYRDTIKTYKSIDLGSASSEEVFERFGQYEYIYCDLDTTFFWEYHKGGEIIQNAITNYGFSESAPLISLIERKGLLFIDNIRCKAKDCEWYEKLAIKIEKRRHRDSNSGNWLVAYTYDQSSFPQQFLGQFERVSLDISANEVKQVVEKVGKERSKLRRGEKQPYVPEGELIPFVKQNMEYLQSDKGGALKGGALAKKIQGDVHRKFAKEYGEKANYKIATIRNLISKINTGRK